MLYNPIFDYTCDGTLHNGTAIGLINRHIFMEGELPDPCYLYLLRHPSKKRKHSWILERIEDNDLSAVQLDNEYVGPNDTPNMALVCFIIPPDFDYIAFDEDDNDTYIEWDSGHTMNDILEMSEEN